MEPRSYWQATAGTPPWPLTSLPKYSDVVVIGAGVLGCAAAYWLSHAGASVTLIDTAQPGAGASGRNGGLLISGLAIDYTAAVAGQGRDQAQSIYALSLNGFQATLALIKREGIECDLRLSGHLNLSWGTEQAERMQQTITLAQADGFELEWLDRPALQARLDLPLAAEISGAQWNPHAASLHSLKLITGLVQAAERNGVQLVTSTQVEQIEHDHNSLRIETGRGRLLAGTAIVTVNSWSSQLLPGIGDLITPVRGQALAFNPIDPLIPCAMGADLTPTSEYWQQTPSGAIVIGGCRAMAPDQDSGVRAQTATTELQAAIENILPQIFPTIGPLRVERAWGGTMGFTRDKLPIVGQYRDWPVFYAGGFSGHGMPFAVELGRQLAQAARDSTAPPAGRLLAPDRATLQPH
jgi:gamma-glutamylputrescine oxidase